MTFHQTFYQKHGIKVTREPISRHKSPEQVNLETSFLKAIQSNFVSPQTVLAIEKAVEKYPDSEAVKNHLYVAYKRTNQIEKAIACLHNINKQHPDYAFGVINLVHHYLDKGDINQASQLLREPYDVHRVEKEEFIHHTVFMSYYQAVVRLALVKKDQKTAEQYHRLMFEYDPKDDTVQKISGEILQGRMDKMRSRMIAPSVRKVVALPKFIVGWEMTDMPPVFIHAEVHQLYQYSTDSIPTKIIATLLNLPRETFIQDLENVLADMIRRRDYYLTIEEWDDEKMCFCYHALYFLTELRAYDSLPSILNILRQDEEFLEFWFGDRIHDFFIPLLYRLGETQLPLLQAFITGPNIHNSARGLASNVISQLALRHPERRDEVIQWFKEVIQTHLDQADNDELIDNFLLGDIVVVCLNIKAVELESEITQLFENGWIPPMICGELEDVKKDLHQREEYLQRIEPLPNSIYEMYTEKYTDVIANPKVEEFKKNYVQNLEDDPYSAFLIGKSFGELVREKMASRFDDDYTSQETVRRVEPKIGRNDPCHCGSGKKYKKCHGA